MAKCFESCCKLTQFLNSTKCERGRVITKTVVTCSLSGVGCTNLMLGSWWSLIVEQTDGRHSRLSYSVCRSVVYVYIGLQGGRGPDLTTKLYIFSRPVALMLQRSAELVMGRVHPWVGSGRVGLGWVKDDGSPTGSAVAAASDIHRQLPTHMADMRPSGYWYSTFRVQTT